MEQLLLVNPEHGFTLRFLKERRRTYPGGVPIAGRNPTRRRSWRSPELDTPLPGMEAVGALQLDLMFLMVWDLVDPRDIDRGYTLRVVHTREPGVYGRAVPCDLSLDLLPGGDIFDRLEFTGDDEETDLYAPAIVELAESDLDDD